MGGGWLAGWSALGHASNCLLHMLRVTHWQSSSACSVQGRIRLYRPAQANVACLQTTRRYRLAAYPHRPCSTVPSTPSFLSPMRAYGHIASIPLSSTESCTVQYTTRCSTVGLCMPPVVA